MCWIQLPTSRGQLDAPRWSWFCWRFLCRRFEFLWFVFLIILGFILYSVYIVLVQFLLSCLWLRRAYLYPFIVPLLSQCFSSVSVMLVCLRSKCHLLSYFDSLLSCVHCIQLFFFFMSVFSCPMSCSPSCCVLCVFCVSSFLLEPCFLCVAWVILYYAFCHS